MPYLLVTSRPRRRAAVLHIEGGHPNIGQRGDADWSRHAEATSARNASAKSLILQQVVGRLGARLRRHDGFGVGRESLLFRAETFEKLCTNQQHPVENRLRQRCRLTPTPRFVPARVRNVCRGPHKRCKRMWPPVPD